MKQTLLFTLLLVFALSVRGSTEPNGGNFPPITNPFESIFSDDHKISIYPNPTTKFFSVSNDENVNTVVVFNLVGRKMKTYEAIRGSRYDVSELPNGMYLVQLLDDKQKVITTQRISKK